MSELIHRIVHELSVTINAPKGAIPNSVDFFNVILMLHGCNTIGISCGTHKPLDSHEKVIDDVLCNEISATRGITLISDFHKILHQPVTIHKPRRMDMSPLKALTYMQFYLDELEQPKHKELKKSVTLWCRALDKVMHLKM